MIIQNDVEFDLAFVRRTVNECAWRWEGWHAFDHFIVLTQHQPGPGKAACVQVTAPFGFSLPDSFDPEKESNWLMETLAIYPRLLIPEEVGSLAARLEEWKRLGQSWNIGDDINIGGSRPVRVRGYILATRSGVRGWNPSVEFGRALHGAA